MKNNETKSVILEIMNGLINYTDTHFKHEEELFDKYNYSDVEEHKKIHKNFVDTVLRVKRDYEFGKPINTVEIMAFLSEWLINHIQGTDKNILTFFIKMV